MREVSGVFVLHFSNPSLNFTKLTLARLLFLIRSLLFCSLSALSVQTLDAPNTNPPDQQQSLRQIMQKSLSDTALERQEEFVSALYEGNKWRSKAATAAK